VYTEAPLRGQGIAAAVMRDALAYAAEQGAGLALLHGVRGYYPRFGFSPVWPKYSAAFDSEELAALPCPLAIRPATLHDLPDLRRLYDRAWGGRVACERAETVWAWRLNGGDGPPYGHDARRAWVVVGEDDRAQGYMAGRAPTGEALEVVAGTPEAALSLLAISGRWHREAGLAEARWQLTPDDPLVAFAQGAVAVRLSADYLPDGGWMGRVVDMSALLKALRTEIVSQARQVYPRLKPGDLVMEGGAGGVAVGLRAQPETIAQIKQRDFIQVLFGSVGPAALGLRARLTEAQIELLAACFPPRMAALAVWDWF
jgi:predicted acetyltransferase